MIPEFQINPKIAAYEKEIHRLQTLVDKWERLRETHGGRLTTDFFSAWLDLCYLRNELKEYKKFLIKKVKFHDLKRNNLYPKRKPQDLRKDMQRRDPGR